MKSQPSRTMQATLFSSPPGASGAPGGAPPFPRARGAQGATRSKEEAYKLLKERRADLLARARQIAFELGRRPEGVTTQEVLAAMSKRGVFTKEDEELDRRFIGALFSNKIFAGLFETIGYRTQANPGRNCHAAPRRIWKAVREPKRFGAHCANNRCGARFSIRTLAGDIPSSAKCAFCGSRVLRDKEGGGQC